MKANDASRVISVIDNRIKRRTGVEATTETTWAEVCGVSADGKYASAYLYGETDTPSEDFRLPRDLAVSIGDKVKVAWNARGERWVYDVAVASASKKIEVDHNAGTIKVGDGTSRPAILIADSSGVVVAAHDHDADYSDIAHDHDADYSDTAHEHTSFSGDLSVPRLRVTATDDASLSSTLHPLQVGSTAGQNVVIDDNEVMARNNGAGEMLRLNYDGGEVEIRGGSAQGYLQLGSDLRIGSGQGLGADSLGITNRSGATAKNVYAKGLYVGPDFSNPTPSQSGIQFGADVALFREAANRLALGSGDTLYVRGDDVISQADIRVGVVSITVTSGASNGSVGVTWSALPGTPNAVYTQQSSLPANSGNFVTKTSSSTWSSTGCTLYVYTGHNGGYAGSITFNIHYLAIYLP